MWDKDEWTLFNECYACGYGQPISIKPSELNERQLELEFVYAMRR